MSSFVFISVKTILFLYFTTTAIVGCIPPQHDPKPSIFQVDQPTPKNPKAVTRIRVVSPRVSSLGEGPYLDQREGALYYVDALKGDFLRLDVTSGQIQKRHVGGLVSIIIPYKSGRRDFIVTMWNQLVKLNWDTKLMSKVATVAPGNGQERFNDGKVDPRGRLFIGSVLHDGKGGIVPNGGSLYRLDSKNNLTKVASGFTISNGMAWSNDGAKKLYFNDSEGRKVYVFDYEVKSGKVSNQRVLIDCDKSPDFVQGEYPDGMVIDRYGYLWIAMYNGGRVVKINPETARVVDQILLPRVKIPTSLTFGSYRGQFGIYLTSATDGLKPDEILDDGKILHVTIYGGEVQKFVDV